jgi:hypothetical protein
MSKPSALPRWNDVQSGNSAYNVNPPNAKKDSGWAVGEIPAAQHINWLFQLIYQWLLWLSNWAGGTQTQSFHCVTGYSVATGVVDWSKSFDGVSGEIDLEAVTTPGDHVNDFYLPLTGLVTAGRTIQEIRLSFSQSTATANAVTMGLFQSNVALSTYFAASPATSGRQILTITVGANLTAEPCYLKISSTITAALTRKLYFVEVDTTIL